MGTISTYSNYGGGGGGVVGGGGGGGGHGTVGGTAPDGNSPGGATYGVTELDRLYLGAGGGGGGSYLNVTGGNGGNGGGIIFAAVSTINMTGQIYTAGIDGGAATSSGGGGGGGGGGAGGSIRIEGNNVTAIGATNATPGAGGWYSSPHVQSGGNGGYGRVAVYYTTSFSASISTNYLKHVGVEQSDSLFGSGFETGDLTEWSSSQTDGGHLSVTASSRYWGYFGLKAQIADNNDLYVQDDTPDSETHYRARFYFDPNSITMAVGDTPVIFAGYASTTQVLRIQLQKKGGVYQVRIGMRSDAGTWYDSGWTNINDGWNALEIEWYASVNNGSMKLWVNGSEAQSLDSVDNDASTLTSVRLGALSIPTGTRGTLHYDDFDSRRFSQIGLLPDPGLLFPAPEGGKLYSYDDSDHVHAVTSLSDGSEYRYDENGNMTCRVENDQTYIQGYNTENRISEVRAVTGTCDTPGDTTSSWTFTYDGDGVKVMQVYESGATTLTTRYYMGGAYEVTSDGTTETVRKYYSIAGISVAMNDGTQLLYFLTDHLSSVMAVTDGDGAIVSEQRYMPFGQVRTDVGTITQTDFGYTFQRNMPDMGLMDYKARLYDANIGRFVQPDTMVPGAGNPEAWNKYSYTSNNPITMNDPSGHGSCRNFNGGQGCITNWRTEDKDKIPSFADIINRDAEIEKQRKSGTSTPPEVIIGCGVGEDNNCQDKTGYDAGEGNGEQIPLAQYRSLTETPAIFGRDSYNNKLEMGLAIYQEIVNSDGGVILIGHSAGADAMIIAAYTAIQNGYGNKIVGIVLIDPTLTYQNSNGIDDSLQSQADSFSGAGIPVILVDTSRDGIDSTINQAVEIPTGAKYSHKGVTVSQDVYTQVVSDMANWGR